MSILKNENEENVGLEKWISKMIKGKMSASGKKMIKVES